MRLFVALRPPPSAVTHLRSVVRVTDDTADRWHVTLAFLGEVADPAALHAPLAAAAGAGPPLRLALAGSGEFRRAGAVWIGLAGDLAGLGALAARVASACAEGGVALESRPFRPHLTVGRRRAVDPGPLAGYAGPEWTAREAELVHSTLGRPVRHDVLARFPLGG